MLKLKNLLVNENSLELEQTILEIESYSEIENSAKILFLLGVAYLKLKNPKKAQEYFKKALVLEPTNEKIRKYLEKLKD